MTYLRSIRGNWRHQSPDIQSQSDQDHVLFSSTEQLGAHRFSELNVPASNNNEFTYAAANRARSARNNATNSANELISIIKTPLIAANDNVLV